ncbi:hypothetical protein OK006_7960 [Actinobacteria bacterium OK006]|nr:hypothetical protein OK006_7960 [Actinobacteria bacterium OK006]
MVVKRSFARTALSHRICTGIYQRRLGFFSAELASPWMAQQDSRPGCVNAAAMSGCVPRAAGRAKAAVITDEKGRAFATPALRRAVHRLGLFAHRDGHPARRNRPCADLILDEPQPRTDGPLDSPVRAGCVRDSATRAHLRREVSVAASRFRTSITFMSARSAMRANRLPGSVRADHHRGQLPAGQVNRRLRLTQCHGRRLQVVLLACHSGHRASGPAGPVRWACSSKTQGVAAWQARRW